MSDENNANNITSKQLSNDEFAQVTQLKSDGNGSFAKSDWTKAKEHYQAAIAIYEAKNPTPDDLHDSQKDTLVALFSNLSMAHLKTEDFVEAERAASKCLDFSPNHSKAAYRRANARLQISRRRPRGDATRIQGAVQDIVKCEESEAQRKLSQKIQAESDRVEELKRQSLKRKLALAKEFASAVDVGDRSDLVAAPPAMRPPMMMMPPPQGAARADDCCETNEAGIRS